MTSLQLHSLTKAAWRVARRAVAGVERGGGNGMESGAVSYTKIFVTSTLSSCPPLALPCALSTAPRA